MRHLGLVFILIIAYFNGIGKMFESLFFFFVCYTILLLVINDVCIYEYIYHITSQYRCSTHRALAVWVRCVAHSFIWYLAILFRFTNCYSTVYPSLFYYFLFFFLSIGIHACIHPIIKMRVCCLSSNYLFLCIGSLEQS